MKSKYIYIRNKFSYSSIPETIEDTESYIPFCNTMVFKCISSWMDGGTPNSEEISGFLNTALLPRSLPKQIESFLLFPRAKTPSRHFIP